MRKTRINRIASLILGALIAAAFAGAAYYEDIWSSGALLEADGGSSGGAYVTVPSGSTADLVTFAAAGSQVWASAEAEITGPQNLSSYAQGSWDEDYNSTTGGPGTYYLCVDTSNGGSGCYAVAQMEW